MCIQNIIKTQVYRLDLTKKIPMALKKKIDDLFDYAAHPTTQHLIQGAPWDVFIITFIYILFVSLGPKIMEKRKPFDLRGVIRLYNLANIVFNAMWFLGGMFFSKFLKSCWFCQPNDVPTSVILMASWSYMYLKVFDLLDTVFFVLRKKNNQVSFLHVSHHAIMPFTAWCVAKYVPLITTGLAGVLNTFVHVIMYTYYYKASQGVQLNWIKQYITRIQLTQFVIVFFHSAHLILMPNCDYPKWFACIAFAESSFFMYTFAGYYRKEYYEKPKSIRKD